MAIVYLGLGSNLGDRTQHLARACAVLHRHPAIRIEAVSSLYHTAPVGFTAQDWFLNAVLVLRTELRPRELLDCVLGIEREMGRVRTIKDGPRLIDIDILLWGNDTIEEPGLSIPHPRLHERRFVLVPLAEIAPDIIHPKRNATVRQLLDALNDNSRVERDSTFLL